MFYFPCVLTGQYIPSYSGLKGPCAIILTTFLLLCVLWLFVFNLLLNIGSVGFDIYAIVSCNFSVDCGFIYTLPPMRNLSHNIRMQPTSLAQFDDWQKVVITTATISGALSFIFMAFVLYGRYSMLSKYVYRRTDPLSAFIKKINFPEPQHHSEAARRNPNVLIVNPFFDNGYTVRDVMDIDIDSDSDDGDGDGGGGGGGGGDGDGNGGGDGDGNGGGGGGDGDGEIKDPFLSSLLTPTQCVYFQSIFWFNFSVYVVNVVLLAIIVQQELATFKPVLEAFDLLGLIAQLVSQLAALMSCFIFSKVAYAVSNQCLDFARCIFPHKMGQDNVCVNDLKEIDKRYTLLLRNSLGPYSVWFTIHWILYTVSSFMAIAYVADQIIMELYGPEPADKKCHGEHDSECRLKLVYSIFFALEHCILFLYPCFRAASVTRARAKMIKYVSNAHWPNITDQEKNVFITYLKDQNASFKISILCAELTFGFNMAYLSIFVGVLGVVMKLSL